MHEQQHLIYAYALGVSFAVSVALTAAIRHMAVRWEFFDHPGDRKMHRNPVPLMGGVAIVGTFYAVIFAHVFFLSQTRETGVASLLEQLEALFGEGSRVKLGGIFAGSFLIFLLGIVDDLKALPPWLKLVGQIAAAAVLVLSGIRLELFVLSNVWLSALVTIFWIVFMTNAMNFLDNMDGLSGGVSVIAAFSFFLCVQPVEQELVRMLLMVFAGAVAGFLYHNLNPARIFMGDAGSMFNGYILATVAVVGTFHVETTPSRIAVAAPLLALSVPLFDTFSVVYIRWRSGESIMLGDKRHFSHRLVELGMSQRQAVTFIFLVAGVAGLSAALLPVLDRPGTIVILAQTAGVYLLIVLLMNAGKFSGRQGP